MIFAADYPFLDVLWTMLIFFAWIVWLWIMVTILVDVFRRRDIGGWAKAAWVVFLVILPWVGALIYLISQHSAMAERSFETAQRQQERVDAHIRAVSGNGTADEIEKAEQLLRRGAINESEFDALKAKALAVP